MLSLIHIYIAGDADGFEQQAVASDAFRACKPQFYAPLLDRRAVKMHHPNSPFADAHGTDKNQQNSCLLYTSRCV